MPKIVIRQDVFETNSSSMHSISINGNNVKMEKLKLSNDMDFIEIVGGEYGWGYEEYSDWQNKLSYIITWIGLGYDTAEDVMASENFKILDEVVYEYTGKHIKVPEKVGYIDHQSTDMLNEYFEYPEKEDVKNALRELVFSTKYTIVIDNDNH